jgi:hypothetical protein
MISLQDYTFRQRRFAPLSKGNRESSDAPQLKGIIFDVDGTLWYAHPYPTTSVSSVINCVSLPQNYMFGEMRYAHIPSQLLENNR